jgi:hypothetical protein
VESDEVDALDRRGNTGMEDLPARSDQRIANSKLEEGCPVLHLVVRRETDQPLHGLLLLLKQAPGSLALGSQSGYWRSGEKSERWLPCAG